MFHVFAASSSFSPACTTMEGCCSAAAPLRTRTRARPRATSVIRARRMCTSVMRTDRRRWPPRCLIPQDTSFLLPFPLISLLSPSPWEEKRVRPHAVIAYAVLFSAPTPLFPGPCGQEHGRNADWVNFSRAIHFSHLLRVWCLGAFFRRGFKGFPDRQDVPPNFAKVM